MTTPAWARNFNNAPRHCYETHDGRLELVNHPITEPQPCDGDHDPRLTGRVEWLRFIGAFGAASVENPFSGDNGAEYPRHYLLTEEKHPTSDGRFTYCETYLRQRADDDWGVRAVFRVFIDNGENWARIECYDEELVGICELALTRVEKSYHKEVPA